MVIVPFPNRRPVADLRQRVQQAFCVIEDSFSARRELLVKQARFARVLELWHAGEHSTHCIAAELGIEEADVCRLIEEGEGRFCGEGI